MSDYFGALLRSSGVQVQGPARDTLRAPAANGVLDHAAANPLELHGEHVIEASPAVKPQVQREAAPNPPAVPAAHLMPPAATGDAPSAPMPSIAEPANVLREVATIPGTTAVDAHAPAPALPPLARDPLRKVMQWIASDPAQSLTSPTSHKRESSVPTQAAQFITAAESDPAAPPATSIEQSLQVIGKTWDDSPSLPLTPTADAKPASLEDADDPTTVMRTAAARATHATLLAAAQPMPRSIPREEVTEISIGAIHVRVDAPPELSVSRAPAPAPARASRSATRPQRSSLARRALRRL